MTDEQKCLEWLKHRRDNMPMAGAKRMFDIAISALEKQEAAKIVVGKSRGGVTLWHECSKCREPVDAKDTYCSGCGRKLIYEEG